LDDRCVRLELRLGRTGRPGRLSLSPTLSAISRAAESIVSETLVRTTLKVSSGTILPKVGSGRTALPTLLGATLAARTVRRLWAGGSGRRILTGRSGRGILAGRPGGCRLL
jgi:hypothetical protein